jgi:hypothetical protein
VALVQDMQKGKMAVSAIPPLEAHKLVQLQGHGVQIAEGHVEHPHHIMVRADVPLDHNVDLLQVGCLGAVLEDTSVATDTVNLLEVKVVQTVQVTAGLVPVPVAAGPTKVAEAVVPAVNA